MRNCSAILVIFLFFMIVLILVTNAINWSIILYFFTPFPYVALCTGSNNFLKYSFIAWTIFVTGFEAILYLALTVSLTLGSSSTSTDYMWMWYTSLLLLGIIGGVGGGYMDFISKIKDSDWKPITEICTLIRKTCP